MDTILRTLLSPLRPLHSPSAQRTYITTFLLSLTLSFLLFLATLSYILIYINYIPNITVVKDVFLAYPPPPGILSQIPYGEAAAGVVVNLPPDIVSRVEGGAGVGGEVAYPSGIVDLYGWEVKPNQKYDLQVELLMPLSPRNRNLGNFMVEVDLYSERQDQPERPVLFHRTHRPVILTYHSPLPSLLTAILKAPLLLAHITTESELITVPILERTVFEHTPKSLRVTLKAQGIQTYKVRVRFRARLGGLRNFMYSYRLIAAGVFVSVFWVIEVVCAVGVWWALVGVGRGAGGGGVVQVLQVKKEELGEGEEEEETPMEAERVPKPSTPGVRPRTPRARDRERGYLPSPSTTPQPQPQLPQEILLTEPVREGYADNEESETDESMAGGVEGPAWDMASARRRVMVEDGEAEGSEEEAVLVSGRGSAGVTTPGDSGVGSSLYESTSVTTGDRKSVV